MSTKTYQQYPPVGNLAVGDFTETWRVVIDDGLGTGEGTVTISVLGEKVISSSAVTTTNFNGVLSGTDTDLQTALDTVDNSDLARYITDATTSRSITDTDRNKIIRFTSASAVAYTIQPVSVAGHQTGFIQEGDGQVTMTLSGVTATPSTALKTLRKGSYVHITYLTTTLVQLSGELTS